MNVALLFEVKLYLKKSNRENKCEFRVQLIYLIIAFDKN